MLLVQIIMQPNCRMDRIIIFILHTQLYSFALLSVWIYSGKKIIAKIFILKVLSQNINCRKKSILFL